MCGVDREVVGELRGYQRRVEAGNNTGQDNDDTQPVAVQTGLLNKLAKYYDNTKILLLRCPVNTSLLWSTVY